MTIAAQLLEEYFDGAEDLGEDGRFDTLHEAVVDIELAIKVLTGFQPNRKGLLMELLADPGYAARLAGLIR